MDLWFLYFASYFNNTSCNIVTSNYISNHNNCSNWDIVFPYSESLAAFNIISWDSEVLEYEKLSTNWLADSQWMADLRKLLHLWRTGESNLYKKMCQQTQESWRLKQPHNLLYEAIIRCFRHAMLSMTNKAKNTWSSHMMALIIQNTVLLCHRLLCKLFLIYTHFIITVK